MRSTFTDEMLHEAAQIFSNNYCVWSSEAAKYVGPFARPLELTALYRRDPRYLAGVHP